MEEASKKNIYDILGISEDSSPEEIQEAYRKAKTLFSQDRPLFLKTFNEKEAQRLNQLIEKAFISLSSNLDFMEKNEHVSGTRFSTYKKNQEMEERIEKTESFDGSFLREIRVYKNISLNQIWEVTKINMLHLTSIENNDFERLPDPVFVRGYVKKIAEILELDVNKVVFSYMQIYRYHLEDK